MIPSDGEVSGGIPEAPLDDGLYGRKMETWQRAAAEGHQHDVATTSANGLMSSGDKANLIAAHNHISIESMHTNAAEKALWNTGAIYTAESDTASGTQNKVCISTRNPVHGDIFRVQLDFGHTGENIALNINGTGDFLVVSMTGMPISKTTHGVNTSNKLIFYVVYEEENQYSNVYRLLSHIDKLTVENHDHSAADYIASTIAEAGSIFSTSIVKNGDIKHRDIRGDMAEGVHPGLPHQYRSRITGGEEYDAVKRTYKQGVLSRELNAFYESDSRNFKFLTDNERTALLADPYAFHIYQHGGLFRDISLFIKVRLEIEFEDYKENKYKCIATYQQNAIVRADFVSLGDPFGIVSIINSNLTISQSDLINAIKFIFYFDQMYENFTIQCDFTNNYGYEKVSIVNGALWITTLEQPPAK